MASLYRDELPGIVFEEPERFEPDAENAGIEIFDTAYLGQTRI